MSDTWAIESDVLSLQAECRGLREDLDNLLAENQRQGQELAGLKRWFTALRDRVDHNERVPA